MVIPAKARKEARIAEGDVLDVELQGDGRLLLIRLDRPPEPPFPKAKITYRKGRHAVVTTGRKLTNEQIRALLDEFP
jgi:AbrB family looped-hinge helix DNA binding protein